MGLFRKIRKKLYKTAKVMGDLDSVIDGKPGKRVKRRIAGKIAGKILKKLK